MLSLPPREGNLLIDSPGPPFGPTTKDAASATVESLREGFTMVSSVVLPLVMSVCVLVTCQQPLDDLSEISPPYQQSGNLEKRLLQQCESFAQTLSEENERLQAEMRLLRAKVEALEELGEEEEDEEEEDGSDESKEPSRSLRSRRAAGCEGGTLAAWACAPQCVFKLKGLCGLSLKSICHC